jgi:hypothetical protein
MGLASPPVFAVIWIFELAGALGARPSLGEEPTTFRYANHRAVSNVAAARIIQTGKTQSILENAGVTPNASDRANPARPNG